MAMLLSRFFLAFVISSYGVSCLAQASDSALASGGYSLSVEVVTENIGTLVGALGVVDLTGFSCTRLYVNMANESDFMSSISGDSNVPTYVNTTTNFYHAALGAATPNGINSILFPVYPDLVYDSWVTIGLESVPNASAGEAAVATVQSTENPWVTNFDPGGGLPGGSIVIDDLIGGAWYALNGDANGVAGEDLKVLVGQFTTTGELSGQLYCQIFPNGDGQQNVLYLFPFGGADIPGCVDSNACNFNPDATSDDGSCDYSCYGCTDAAACNYDATATLDDNACTYADAGYDCDGNCLSDSDGDGICDAFEIAGCNDATACNYDATATDDDGSCTYADAGYDCAGNCLSDTDEDGVCDEFEVGGCDDDTACNYNATATDNDGSCDYSCYGCTDAAACNYDAAATLDDNACTYADAGYDCDGNCLSDSDGDGICDDDDPCEDPDLTPEVLPTVPTTLLALVTLDAQNAPGMTVIALVDGVTIGVGEIITFEGETYINISLYVSAGDEVSFQLFDPAACALYDTEVTFTMESGVLELGSFDDPEDLPFLSGNFILGCIDPAACNYSADADLDDGSCTYPDETYLDCNGNCLNDADEDGICDELEVAGCQDDTACNYNEDATDDDGSCVYAEDFYDCDGGCLNDADDDGICDELEVAGCQDDTACNYNADATDEDGSCTYAEDLYDCDDNCLNDVDDDGICDELEVAGCQDDTACNYNNAATDDDGSCTYPSAVNLDCEGNCLNDADGDLICDEDEISGCQDNTACNFNEAATDDDGSCEYLTCAGCTDAAACNHDAAATIEDGSCEYLTCAGCADDSACNYDPAATIEDDSCVYADDPCETCNPDGTVNVNDDDGDGVCNADEVEGCTEPEACNYNADATNDDGSCDYSCQGCTDETACNYDAEATVDDGTCFYAFLYYDCDGNCLNDADGDLICDEFETPGCLDEMACNYDGTATDADSSLCVYPIDLYGADNVDCEGNCLNDLDGDGVCDEAEIPGCQDETACNFDAAATEEDGSCVYADDPCETCNPEGTVDVNDADGDGICDDEEIAGCQDATACNYNADATDDDGGCAYMVASEILGATGSFFGDTATYTLDDFLTENNYQWLVQGGDIIAGEDSTSAVIVWSNDTTLGTGTLTVIETADGCAPDTLQLAIELTVNGMEEWSVMDYRLAPNPAIDGFRLIGPVDELLTIRLLQRDGRLLKLWQGRAGEWYPVEGLTSGWYIVEIQSGERRQALRLVRMH